MSIKKLIQPLLAIDDKEQITEVVTYVKQNFPNVHIVARAVDRSHVYELFAAGASDIIRDTFDSATRAGRSALEALGMTLDEAERQIENFVQFDRYALREVAELYKPDVPVADNPDYIQKVRELQPLQDDIMQGKVDLEDVLKDKNIGDNPVTESNS